MATFNQAQFLAQFATFTPSTDWEYRFATSLHKQVTFFKKELTEKQVNAWEKLIAPKVEIAPTEIKEEAKTFMQEAESLLANTDEWGQNFITSLLTQVKQGKELSSRQMFIYGRVKAKATPKVEAPKTTAKAKKATPKTTAKAEAPKTTAKAKTTTKKV